MQKYGFINTLTELGERKKLATMLRSAASDNRIALDALEQKDRDLHTFLRHYLDDEQRKLLALDPVSEIEPQLDGMRELGREAEIFLDNEAFSSDDSLPIDFSPLSTSQEKEDEARALREYFERVGYPDFDEHDFSSDDNHSHTLK